MTDVCRLLVVEDDHVCAYLCEQAFKGEAFEVLTVMTLAEARQKLHSERLDLVLLDLGLPDGDGLSLLDDCQVHGLPAIVMTYRDHPDDRVFGLKTGAQDYVTKPFHPDELLIRAEKLLAGHRSSQLTNRGGSNARVFPLTLDEARLLLVDSDGVSLQLTKGEAQIIKRLLRPDGFASHDALTQAVARESGVGNDRSVAVLVSRLRKKLRASVGFAHWHIEPVYGAGYQLLRKPS